MTLLAGGAASAGTRTGDKAETLTYALHYAGSAKPASITCVETLDRDGGMSDYRCTLGTTEVKDAAAYLVFNAMAGLGFPQKVLTETTIQISGKNVSCVNAPAAKGDDRFACTGDEIHGDIKITPKKVPVKDIVQPVKIEKQEKRP